MSNPEFARPAVAQLARSVTGRAGTVGKHGPEGTVDPPLTGVTVGITEDVLLASSRAGAALGA